MPIDVSELESELTRYATNRQEEIRDIVYRQGELSDAANTVMRVDGDFPLMHSVPTRTIKEFNSIWEPAGDFKFVPNILKSYHQKANIEIIPADVYRSWISFMYRERLPLEQKPISQYIMDHLAQKALQQDIAFLEYKGVYSAGTGNFGDSMDGLSKILADGILSANSPMFRIPLDAITDANIVEAVEKFELMLPTKVEGLIKTIYMSKTNLKRYWKRYKELYGDNNNFQDADGMKSPFNKYELKGHAGLEGSDLFWCTTDENLLKLIDEVETPFLTDVQRFDYKLKMFFEFSLGYGFWTNQLVFVSDIGGTTRGLLNNHSLYYPETATTKL